jgi:cytochrome c-type biogenesis protein CcsB
MPSQKRIEHEILFNKLKIFEKLTPIYLFSGILLLIFVIIRIMKPSSKIKMFFKVFYAINILAFSAHTVGLALRWYVSGHAPWSNTYESLVYIAWALSLSGIIFSKRSAISLALTSILAGVTLFVAHLNMVDPQITNIQPVLDSYWLTIHVSVITASYGFLGLCSLLGAFALILFILYRPNKNAMILKNITEAVRINEMSMIMGLCLLTVGNFLGGIWANESWGRYWGWDSKETWSLVTILFYASIVHFRFISRLNSQYWFAVFSMFAYASVIMTYFGVNFYLSGMHSYASGEQVPVPSGVWISAILMFALVAGAFFKRKYSSKLL